MSSAISDKYNINGGRLGTEITRVARKIKNALGVVDWNRATEKQLKQRDEIHRNIMFGVKICPQLSLAVEMAIKETLGCDCLVGVV